MKESIAAIRWILRGMMIVLTAVAGWMTLKVYSDPGYVSGLVLGDRRGQVATLSDPAAAASPAARRLPQTHSMPQSGARVARDGIATQVGRSEAKEAGATRRSATGAMRTMTRKNETPAPAYSPPVAQRKVIRVGE